MGTPHFAVPTLEKLLANSAFEIVAVYTREPQIAGRVHKLTNSPIHDLALKNNLKIITPKTLRDVNVQKEFVALNADVAVVVAYGLLLPEEILNGTKFGCFNIHPSLLPRWRGAAPIQRTIMAGDRDTAVDIIKMDIGLDSGDIVAEEKLVLNGNETYADLAPKLSEIGAALLCKTMEKLAVGEKLQHTKQNHDAAIYAKKIEKSECEIDWNFSAKEIEQKIRGLNGSLGAYFIFREEKIKIFAAEISRNDENFSAEKIGKFVENKFEIYCQRGILKPLIVQRAGGKRMAVEEMLRGM